MVSLRATVAAVLMLSCTETRPEGKPASLRPVELPADHPVIAPLPDPEINGGHTGRAPRRISVAQLKQSIQTVTGRQWTKIDVVAASLGQADYAVSVTDATEPNLVFAKFVQDGAKEVCINVARDDLLRAQDARVLWPEVPGMDKDFTGLDAATIEKNLLTLSVRFWGSALSADELPTWVSTFKTLAARAKTINKPEQAWGAICVAMMTDPRFITY